MKKFMVMATAGVFLLSLQGAQAQKEVQPPSVPPMLEGQRPLEMPETKEPQKLEEGKVKPGTKARAKKAQKKAASKKQDKKKLTAANKKKGPKGALQKKRPATEPKEAGPGEG